MFFLGLFVFGRNDRTILYFALFCIVFSYRMVGTNHYALHSLFSDMDWFITTRLEYLTLSIGIILFTLYTGKLYPDDSHPVILKGMIWFCILYTAVIIFTPTLVFTKFLVYFLLVMFLCIAYAMYIYIQAARHKRSGSLFALLSTAVMLFIFLMMNLHYFLVIPDLRIPLFFRLYRVLFSTVPRAVPPLCAYLPPCYIPRAAGPPRKIRISVHHVARNKDAPQRCHRDDAPAAAQQAQGRPGRRPRRPAFLRQ
ncbi:7TM-DISM domain-containing protein [Puia sp. P3]|uniref:7TM-DISM domain-containing protein n=1 Tax=Puia sp. P3 TaxID=3423952 RepID=UPI003D67097B